MELILVRLGRMRKEPSLYNISVDKLKEDPDLEQHRADIVHTAAFLLEKCGLIKYDRKFGHLQVFNIVDCFVVFVTLTSAR